MLLFGPKEQIGLESAILNWAKLHSDLKKFGRNKNFETFPNIEVWFLGRSFSSDFSTSTSSPLFLLIRTLCAVAIEKICIVPLSEEHAKNEELGSKHTLYISAFSDPLRTSCRKSPFSVLNILISVPWR